MKKIAVFFGGESVEHDVSIITGVMISNGFQAENYQIIPVYVDKKGWFFTGEKLKDIEFYKNFDIKKLDRITFVLGSNVLHKVIGKKLKATDSISVAINCMHGSRGEDGSIAGLMKLCNIPIAFPDILSEAISIDKSFSKIALRGIGVKCLPYLTVNGVEGLDKKASRLNYPLIVKPNGLGSSIGISKANNSAELKEGVLTALRFDDKVIIEPCLENFKEINCAVYKTSAGELKTSELERPIGKEELLSFADKYKGGERIFPADVDDKTREKIQNISKRVYEKLNFYGVIRIDYLLKDGKVFLNEINSVPGSLAYYLFCDTVKEFSGVLLDIVEGAIKNYAKNSSAIKKYDSEILKGLGSKGAKHL